MARLTAADLNTNFLRLRPDATAETLPVTEHFWADLKEGRLGDFHHEYLVSVYGFEADWTSWECHPHGDEIVVLLGGAVDFILEADGGNDTVALRKAGEFVLVPRNTWHTANVLEASMALFITAGEGTQMRER